jgi:hypothetical protein
MVGQVFDGLVAALTKAILSALDALWKLLSATVFTTPDVTDLPQVAAVASTSLGIVNAAYVLAIIAAGVMIMARDTVQTVYGPGELIPRLVIGLIAANLALPLCSAAIDLSNALTTAFTGQGLTSEQSLSHLRQIVDTALSGGASAQAGLLLAVIALLIVVLVGIMIVQWVTRLGLLIILVGIAPLALALHGAPYTEAAAKLWWRALAGALSTVVLQALAMHTALTVLLSPQASLPALGVPGDPGTVMNLLIVVCMLLAVVRIPGLVRRYVTRSRGGGLVAGTSRVLITRYVTRGLLRSAPASSGRAAAAPAGWPVR